MAGVVLSLGPFHVLMNNKNEQLKQLTTDIVSKKTRAYIMSKPNQLSCVRENVHKTRLINNYCQRAPATTATQKNDKSSLSDNGIEQHATRNIYNMSKTYKCNNTTT